jgi:hypothetical protein
MSRPQITSARTTLLSLRERGLLVGALWLFALVGAFVLFRQYSAANTSLKAVQATIREQQFTLDSKEEINAQLDAHKQRLAAGKTLHGTNLQTLVSSLAGQARLTPEFAQPNTAHKNGIQTTTLRVTFRDVSGTSLDKLLRFDDLLRLRAQKLPIVVALVTLTATPREGISAIYDIQTYCVSEKPAARAKP